MPYSIFAISNIFVRAPANLKTFRKLGIRLASNKAQMCVVVRLEASSSASRLVVPVIVIVLRCVVILRFLRKTSLRIDKRCFELNNSRFRNAVECKILLIHGGDASFTPRNGMSWMVYAAKELNESWKLSLAT